MENAIAQSLNVWAILVATVASFVIGALWYSPLLFGKAWQRLAGLSDEQLAAGSPARIFGIAFLFQLVAALVLAPFLGPDATLSFGAMAGFMAGLGWAATMMGTVQLFERRPMSLWAINAGYAMVALTVMGAIIGGWR